MRVRAAAGLALLAVAVAAVAGCGSSSKLGTSGAAAGTKTGAGTSTAPATPAVAELGCGTYCRQAGGYGGGAVNLPFLVRVEGKTATLTPDGAVPVTLSCIGPAACEGALIVGLSGGTNTELGRSDIAVPQGATRTLGVPVTPAGSSALAGRTSAGIFVTADVFPTLQKLPRAQQNGYDALGFGMLTLTVPPDARR